MRFLAMTVVALGVAACGTDGEPVQPTASTNVTLASSGVYVGTNVGVRQGPFSINLGLGL